MTLAVDAPITPINKQTNRIHASQIGHLNQIYLMSSLVVTIFVFTIYEYPIAHTDELYGLLYGNCIVWAEGKCTSFIVIIFSRSVDIFTRYLHSLDTTIC